MSCSGASAAQSTATKAGCTGGGRPSQLVGEPHRHPTQQPCATAPRRPSPGQPKDEGPWAPRRCAPVCGRAGASRARDTANKLQTAASRARGTCPTSPAVSLGIPKLPFPAPVARSLQGTRMGRALPVPDAGADPAPAGCVSTPGPRSPSPGPPRTRPPRAAPAHRSATCSPPTAPVQHDPTPWERGARPRAAPPATWGLKAPHPGRRDAQGSRKVRACRAGVPPVPSGFPQAPPPGVRAFWTLAGGSGLLLAAPRRPSS